MSENKPMFNPTKDVWAWSNWVDEQYELTKDKDWLAEVNLGVSELSKLASEFPALGARLQHSMFTQWCAHITLHALFYEKMISELRTELNTPPALAQESE